VVRETWCVLRLLRNTISTCFRYSWPPVTRGVQRETRNPGGKQLETRDRAYPTSFLSISISVSISPTLDASVRWPDDRGRSHCFCSGAEYAALWRTQE
jgi:hypothetical protein